MKLEGHSYSSQYEWSFNMIIQWWTEGTLESNDNLVEILIFKGINIYQKCWSHSIIIGKAKWNFISYKSTIKIVYSKWLIFRKRQASICLGTS